MDCLFVICSDFVERTGGQNAPLRLGVAAAATFSDGSMTALGLRGASVLSRLRGECVHTHPLGQPILAFADEL
jgi:hypothetical protein